MFILLVLIPLPSTIAEYRAFELVIENKATGTQRKVITTMDHLQYPTYYPLQKEEEVFYSNSWICWQNTGGFQEVCPAPEREPAEQKPSSKSN